MFAFSAGRRGIAWIFIACLVSAAVAADAEVVPPEIKVPAGYSVTVAVPAPLVAHPVMAGFDDQGRLYVAENAGVNLPKTELEAQLPSSILRFEDKDGDGQFETRTVFADKLTFPQGAVWYRGSVYVASSGSIWKFTDTNDDGVADRREQLVDKFGYTGNAADVHGCFIGPEGRIYWCEGRHGHEFRTPSGILYSKGKAARIFSCRPDGSDVQTHCGGGMDNPVEVDWTAGGDMLGTVNIFYEKRGDCLVHWMRGGVYPRNDQQDVIAEFPRTGPLLDAVHDFGHVAVSGTTRIRTIASVGQLDADKADRSAIPEEFLVTQFNTHKVVRCRLRPEGSTYACDVEDFLTAGSADFHPTDILEDADGSLLLVDTGGWFRIGCPTSQIARPNILGAIYRIRKDEMAKPADPWGKKIAWENQSVDDLVKLLEDGRFAVREKAEDRLAQAIARSSEREVLQLQDTFETAMAKQGSIAKVALLRAASKSERAEMLPVLVRGTIEADPAIRTAAIYALGWLNHPGATAVLQEHLALDHVATVDRAAATALSRKREASSVPFLLGSLQVEQDPVIRHATTHALIEIGNANATRNGLTSDNPAVIAAALTALDQMPRGNLDQSEVVQFLGHSHPLVQSTVLAILTRHADWSDSLVDLVAKSLQKPTRSDVDRQVVLGAIQQFAGKPALQALVAEGLGSKETSVDTQLLLLEGIAQAEITSLPATWQAPLAQLLGSSNAEVVASTLSAVKNLRAAAAFSESLEKLVARDGLPTALTLEGWSQLLSTGHALSPQGFEQLLATWKKDSSPSDRLTAAQGLSQAKLEGEQLLKLAQVLPAASPLELPILLSAFRQTKEASVGMAVAGALLKTPAATGLTPALLTQSLSQFPEEVQTSVKKLQAELEQATKTQRENLAAIAAALPSGDVARGREVFFSRKTACSSCHQVGKEGGRVGPDLTDVGKRRARGDLLEAVVYPSLSLVRGFESHNAILDDGRLVTGILVSQTQQSIVLRRPDLSQERLSTKEVTSLTPSPLSLMPAGLEKTMTPAQLADLLAYLQSLQGTPTR